MRLGDLPDCRRRRRSAASRVVRDAFAARVPNPRRRRALGSLPAALVAVVDRAGDLDGRGSRVGRQRPEHGSRRARRTQRGTAADAASRSGAPARQLVERPVDRRAPTVRSGSSAEPGTHRRAGRPTGCSRSSSCTAASLPRSTQGQHPLVARPGRCQRRPVVRRRLSHRVPIRGGAARRRGRRHRRPPARRERLPRPLPPGTACRTSSPTPIRRADPSGERGYRRDALDVGTRSAVPHGSPGSRAGGRSSRSAIARVRILHARDGSLFKQIPLPAGVHQLAISPTGPAAVTTRSASGQAAIVLVHPQHPWLAPRTIFRGAGRFNGLAWSPDGKWLLASWAGADQWVFINVGIRSGAIRRVQAVSAIARSVRRGRAAGPRRLVLQLGHRTGPLKAVSAFPNESASGEGRSRRPACGFRPRACASRS